MLVVFQLHTSINDMKLVAVDGNIIIDNRSNIYHESKATVCRRSIRINHYNNQNVNITNLSPLLKNLSDRLKEIPYYLYAQRIFPRISRFYFQRCLLTVNKVFYSY